MYGYTLYDMNGKAVLSSSLSFEYCWAAQDVADACVSILYDLRGMTGLIAIVNVNKYPHLFLN